jgi:hypothetical protein
MTTKVRPGPSGRLGVRLIFRAAAYLTAARYVPVLVLRLNVSTARPTSFTSLCGRYIRPPPHKMDSLAPCFRFIFIEWQCAKF